MWGWLKKLLPFSKKSSAKKYEVYDRIQEKLIQQELTMLRNITIRDNSFAVTSYVSVACVLPTKNDLKTEFYNWVNNFRQVEELSNKLRNFAV